ncbi:MAG: hemerythrin domain-containing protein [Flavobacteriales bacterium]
MKIVDRETGKRLKEVDPVIGNPEKDIEIQNDELSPMDPPDAYSSYASIEIENGELNESLIILKKEHEELITVLDVFEKALADFKELGYVLNNDVNEGFKKFFDFFDNDLLPHNRKEEKILFPVLQKALLANNEHGVGKNPVTAVDIMEDDHVKFIQLGTLTFNLLGLAPRFRDAQSKMFTYDVAYNNAKELVELIRLHVFREDNTLFPLAQKYLTDKQFEDIILEMNTITTEDEHSEEHHHHH